jgi:hypothetical protein
MAEKRSFVPGTPIHGHAAIRFRSGVLSARIDFIRQALRIAITIMKKAHRKRAGRGGSEISS